MCSTAVQAGTAGDMPLEQGRTELSNEGLTIGGTESGYENEEPRSRRRGKLLRWHSLDEAGSSRWAPWWMLMMTRFVSSGSCIGLGVYLYLQPWVQGGNVFHPLIYLIVSCFVSGCSLLALALCSGLYEWNEEHARVSTAVMMLYANAVGFTVALAPGAVLLWQRSGRVVLIFLPIAVFLLDILIMQSKLKPDFLHGLPSVLLVNALGIANVGLYKARPRNAPVGRDMYFHLGYLVCSLACYFVMFSLTRIPWKIVTRGRRTEI